MPYLSCLVCGRLSDQSYCSQHRNPRSKARGYDYKHIKKRKDALAIEPWCHYIDPNTKELCGSMEELQLHHIYGKNRPEVTILCRYHNRLIGKPGYSSNV